MSVCLLVLATSSAFAFDANVDEICAKARKASGVDSVRGTWHATGRSHLSGMDQAFEMVFDDQYRFRASFGKTHPGENTFDGMTFWTSGPARIPHRAVLANRDTWVLFSWVFSGLWAKPGVELRKELTGSFFGQWTLTLTPPGEAIKATLTLDAATALPKKLSFWSPLGEETWSFSGYKLFGSRRLPTRLVDRNGSAEDLIEITNAGLVNQKPDYGLPAPDPDKAALDPSASHSVELKYLGGKMFVHPKVDGADAGWFILDTGASQSCIDIKLAKRLKLAHVRSAAVSGVVGGTQGSIDQAKTFQLGPLTVKAPTFYDFDLSALSSRFEIPIGGICGYDVVAHAAWDIDATTNRMDIYQPGGAELPAGAQWTELQFSGNIPIVACRYDDYSGLFFLDTGSSTTVDLFTPEVEKRHLLDGRATEKAQTRGLGGATESREGKIERFSIGPNSFDKPTVRFQLTKIGIFACPYVSGNIGTGFLGTFRMILDYQNERIAIVPSYDGAFAPFQ